MHMASRTEIKARLSFWNTALEDMQRAYLALVDGGVKSYTIGDRQVTRLDIPDLLNKIEEAERKVDELTALLQGRSARKAFGIIPRDW